LKPGIDRIPKRRALGSILVFRRLAQRRDPEPELLRLLRAYCVRASVSEVHAAARDVAP
jgi:hypothetical protein